MPTSVLLSIKPEFAEKIFAGFKKYEFRRVVFKSRSVSKVVVYASSPVKRVIGEFDIGGILALGRRALWLQTKQHSGIEKAHFDRYFRGKATAYAIEIRRPRRYRKALKLDHLWSWIRPPQSFRYLEPDWLEDHTDVLVG